MIALMALAGLFIFGYTGKGVTQKTSVQNSANALASRSFLTATEASFDFGSISMKDGNVTKNFTVTNSTNKTVTIATVLTSCMCTSAFIVEANGNTKGPFGMAGMGRVPPADEAIPAGENRIIRVVYDPNAHGPSGVGRINRLVTLTDTEGGTLDLEIKALVTP